MVARAYTVAFEGVEARTVEVQCALSPGVPAFSIVGLPDKAVSEARDRVRAALSAMAIALPARKITVNLSPADLPKEGSHFDLPIALALLAAIGVIPEEDVAQAVALGELSLDGSLVPVIGALPAAMAAAEDDRALVCPQACGAEAAWVGAAHVIAAGSLAAVIQHFTGQSPLPPADPGEVRDDATLRDLAAAVGAPVLTVVAPGLGTLNHTALTLEALAAHGVPGAGLVIGSWPAHPGAAIRGCAWYLPRPVRSPPAAG